MHLNLKVKRCFFILLILSFVNTSLPAYSSSSISAEVYLEPGQYLISNTPNSLYVSSKEISIIDSFSTKFLISKNKLNKVENNDFYLTLVYLGRTNKLVFYNHANYLATIDLNTININVRDLFNNLEDGFESGSISYFEEYNRTLNPEQVLDRYKDHYSKVKVESTGITKTTKAQVTGCGAPSVTWNNMAMTNIWSDGGNWVGGVAPNNTQIACFDMTSTQNATIDVDIDVLGIRILPAYTGMIDANMGTTITVGTDGFNQNGATFTSTDGDLIANGTFDQFSGTFNHNNGTVIVTGTSTVTTNSNLNNLTAGRVDTQLIFNDAFDMSNQELNMHTPTGTGANWERVIQIGGARIRSGNNRAERQSAGGNDGAVYISNITGDADYSSANYEIAVTQINGDTGDDPCHLITRYQTGGDLYSVKWNETAAQGINFYKRVSGTWTNIGSCASISVMDGSAITFRVTDSLLEFVDDGIVICTAMDSSITMAGRAGLGYGNIGITGLLNDDISAQRLDNYMVTLNISENATATLGNSLTLDGNLSIGTTNSSLDVSNSNHAINIAGNWNNLGTFTPQQGLVTFNGTGQSINGSNTFYDFDKTTGTTDTLTFEEGETQTIQNLLTVQGANLNELSLVSTTMGTQWNIDPQSTRTISFVDIEDSNNIGSGIDASGANNIDSGNNTNWCFAACPATNLITLAGLTLESDAITPLTSKMVTLAINGNDRSTVTSDMTTGEYTFTDVLVTEGDVATVYLEGETEDAVAVKTPDGTGETTRFDFNLIQDKLSIRNDLAGVISVANLSTGLVSGEDDITNIYEATSSNLEVKSGKDLFIPSGITFTPGANFSAEDIDIDGTLDLGSSQARITGSWDQSGTFLSGTSKVFLKGTTTLNSSSTFNDIEIGEFNESIIFVDTFSGAQSVLDMHAPDTGNNWENLISIGGGTLEARANRLERLGGGANDGALYIANIAGNADYSIADYDVTITQINGDTADDTNIIAGRIQTNGDLYAARWNETASQGIRLFKRVSNVWSEIQTCAGTSVADGSIVTFSFSGDMISFLDDGVSVCSVTDSSISSPGRAGIGQGNIGIAGFTADDLSGQFLDNFMVQFMIDDSGSVTLGNDLTLTGDLAIGASATLDVGDLDNSITLAGDWLNSSGTFTARSGLVTLNGTGQSINGNTSFNSLTKVVNANDTLTFEADSIQSLQQVLTLQATAGMLSLRSSTPGTQWRTNVQALPTLQNVDVQDGNNIGVTLNASNGGVDSGNNTNWCFAACPSTSILTVSGRAVDTNGFTPLSGKTIRFAIDGEDTSTTSTTNASGVYNTASLLLGAGSILTAYIEDDADDAVTVTISDGATNLTDFDLVKDSLTIRNDNSGSTTNTNLETAIVTAEDDITNIYQIAGSLITPSNKKVNVHSGDTFTPGGSLFIGSIDVDGTLDLGANNASVFGDWDGSQGTLMTTTGTVFFNNTLTLDESDSFGNISIGEMSTFTIFEDPFTNTNGLELSMHTPNTAGNNWEQIIQQGSGTIEIRTNRIEPLATGNSMGALYVANLKGNSDYISADYEVSLTQNNGDTGDDTNYIAGRIQTNGDLYTARWSETATQGIRIFKKESDAWTELQNCAGVGVADGSTIIFRLNGTSIEFEDDGMIVCSVVDSSITGAGRAGVGQGNVGIPGLLDDLSTQRLDNFMVSFSVSETGNVTLEDNLNLSGNLTIETGGTLNTSASDFDITLAGNWTNNGTFTPQEGTVTLNGTGQSINGDNTFFNLSKVATGTDTLTFEANMTQTITNSWTAQGNSIINLLSLVSSIPATQWMIDPQGGRNILHLNVTDSNNINATQIKAGGATANIMDSGNNTGWDFATDPFDGPTPLTISSTKPDGTYNEGENIIIDVTFDESVNVTGTPTLALNAGNGSSASFSGGSGTATLQFSYTVSPGHNTSDLDYTSTSALALSGGTIQSVATSMDAILILPSPGAIGSLGFNKNIMISTSATGPVVISSPTEGQSVGDPVTVTGTGPAFGTIEILVLEINDGATTTADGSGNFSVQLPTLSAGTYTIIATSVNNSGVPTNISPAISFMVL